MKLADELSGFTGTENYYVHSLFGYKMTDGAKYLCDVAHCFWLAELIYSWQGELKKRYGAQCNGHDKPCLCFQVWTLRKTEKGWIARCEDADEHYLCSQEIQYSDFPDEDGVKLFFQNGVLFLPSEY